MGSDVPLPVSGGSDDRAMRQAAEGLDGRIAATIWRGVARRLIDADQAVLAELPLGNGGAPISSRSTAAA